MSAEGSIDRKKQVCTTLVGIVRGSPLASAIDPSAFFMQLNANYGALVRGETMDLNLLWTTLSTQHGSDNVAGLFFKFADAGQRLGFTVSLPPPLANMPDAERRARVARFDGGSNPRMTGLPAAGPPQASVPTPRTPLRTEIPHEAHGGHGLIPTPRAAPPMATPARGLPSPARGLPSAGLPSPGLPAPSAGLPAPSAGLPSPSAARRTADMTPLPELFEEYEPTPLSEAALAGIPDDTQRRIISTLVGALKATEAGPHLSAPQLSYFLASRFAVLCDGGQFFFQAVYEAVLELQGVEERHVYQAAVRFRRWLARIGIQLVEPNWKLDAATRARLEEQANKVPLDTYSPIAKTMSANSAQPAPAEPAPAEPAGPSTAVERQEKRLREWGLRGLTRGQSFALRLGVGALLVLLALGLRVVFDPLSSVDTDSYAAVIPLADAALYEGKWLGTLDEKAWRALPLEKRQKALRDLTAILGREKRIAGARLVHPKTKVVIGFDVKGVMQVTEAVLHLGLDPPAPSAKAAPSSATPSPH